MWNWDHWTQYQMSLFFSFVHNICAFQIIYFQANTHTHQTHIACPTSALAYLMICKWNTHYMLTNQDLIGLLSRTHKEPNSSHLSTGTIYAWTRQPAQSILCTKEHHICLQRTVYIVSQQAVNNKLRNVYLSVRRWQHCWPNKVLIVTVKCDVNDSFSQTLLSKTLYVAFNIRFKVGHSIKKWNKWIMKHLQGFKALLLKFCFHLLGM